MAAPETEYSALDDEELVARAQRDDQEAFRELFDRYYSMIYSYVYRASLDAAGAQDIAQETFIKAARNLETFRREASFKAWLYRIATNATRDWHRERDRRGRLSQAVAESWDGETADVPNDAAPTDRVAEALQALPEDLRLAIVLVYYEGLNHSAAGRVLDCAETTVSWRIFRAKRRLKTLLSQKEAQS